MNQIFDQNHDFRSNLIKTENTFPVLTSSSQNTTFTTAFKNLWSCPLLLMKGQFAIHINVQVTQWIEDCSVRKGLDQYINLFFVMLHNKIEANKLPMV